MSAPVTNDFSYGPSPLTDEEVARVNDLFKYNSERVHDLLGIIHGRSATPEQRADATVQLKKIRGEP